MVIVQCPCGVQFGKVCKVRDARKRIVRDSVLIVIGVIVRVDKAVSTLAPL